MTTRVIVVSYLLFPHLSPGKRAASQGIDTNRHNTETLRHNESEAIIASLFWLPKSLCTSELHFLVAGAAGRAFNAPRPEFGPFGQSGGSGLFVRSYYTPIPPKTGCKMWPSRSLNIFNVGSHPERSRFSGAAKDLPLNRPCRASQASLFSARRNSRC